MPRVRITTKASDRRDATVIFPERRNATTKLDVLCKIHAQHSQISLRRH